jgi:transposase
VNLYGPTRPDYKWQAREGSGFEAAAFSIDWDNEVATCPEGKKSISWTPAIDRQNTKVMKIKFIGARIACRARAEICASARSRTTREGRSPSGDPGSTTRLYKGLVSAKGRPSSRHSTPAAPG